MATTTKRFDVAVPQFTVSDVIETAEYYRDVLGFEIAGYWDGQQVHHDKGKPAVGRTTRPGATPFQIVPIRPRSGPAAPRRPMTSIST